MQLNPNTLLQGGKYKIERILGQGGFGITYLATQVMLDRKVCIKEFFFKEYCERDETTSHVSLGTQNSQEIVERFMTKFLKEARTISQLEHPNIIKIFDIFKENNTAYYVMEYIEGESLSDKVNHYGSLSESEAKDYINQVASALEYIHQRSINHLDVKPANIMVRRADNKAILIDFGLSKQYDAQGGQTSTTPVGISHGYAPMEQYKQGGVSTFSPQTDIYSLGATLYKLVTGNTPPQAMDILDEGLPELPSHLSQSVVKVIKKSMQARKLDRYNNIEEFLRGLDDVSQKTSFTHQETKSQNIKVSDEETKITDIGIQSENVTTELGLSDKPVKSKNWKEYFKERHPIVNSVMVLMTIVTIIGIILLIPCTISRSLSLFSAINLLSVFWSVACMLPICVLTLVGVIQMFKHKLSGFWFIALSTPLANTLLPLSVIIVYYDWYDVFLNGFFYYCFIWVIVPIIVIFIFYGILHIRYNGTNAWSQMEKYPIWMKKATWIAWFVFGVAMFSVFP